MAALFDNLKDTKLVEHIKRGNVGVLPTDTVYGIVCSAKDMEAVRKLYEIKKRDNKPGTIIASNIDQLVSLGLKKRYLTAVNQYWPGAVSVVIPSMDPKTEYLRNGQKGLAVRITDDKNLNNLLDKVGPLLTSSANDPGETPAVNVTEAMAYFGDKVDFYVDGGDYSNKESSTVIRIIDDAVEVLRQGAVKIKENT